MKTRSICFLLLTSFLAGGYHSSLDADAKHHALIGGALSAVCGLGAFGCFYKAGNLLERSVRAELDAQVARRIEQQSTNYRKIGYGLAAGSVLSGLYAVGGSLKALGLLGGAGLLLVAGGQETVVPSQPIMPVTPVKPVKANRVKIERPFNDYYLNQILAQCLEYNEPFTLDRNGPYPANIRPVIPEAVFLATLDEFIRVSEQIYSGGSDFVRKKVLGIDQVGVVTGDIHGSIHSLMRNCIRFMFAGDATYLDPNLDSPESVIWLFTGDGSDRGRWSVEVYYLLMRLFLKNPGRVFLVRGNHEERCTTMVYGLRKELIAKYGDDVGKGLFNLMCTKMFPRLPSAVYVGDGKHFIQVHHGGPAVNRFGELRHPGLQEFLQDPDKDLQTIDRVIALQLRWNDYTVGYRLDSSPRASETWCMQVGTQRALGAYEEAGVIGFFRGHDHNPHGVSYLNERLYFEKSPCCWNGLEHGVEIPVTEHGVYTFMSCPESNPGISCDGFGILKMKPGGYENWTLTPYEYNLPASRDGKLMEVYVNENGGVEFDWVTP